MDQKIALIKNLTELEVCLVDLEEQELQEIEKLIKDIRHTCNACHAFLDEVYGQLGLK